ncbi:uncharacterized protein BDZ99DRAFT_194730 [Mytilinidion resinicola]|uniref:Uncharacterized protein n=1 Tax=Mytilinidion resinicola TaxID=574789 RepID=A0A6A6Z2Z5_9PEZI|nr:uncharacterized protein BDZ99DRAFT_194730 [Mytilinidion resinicola]KAF2815370.1 hypothetical protein BDZ99DRAFT_194730 [Mytilinidion resinicola]
MMSIPYPVNRHHKSSAMLHLPHGYAPPQSKRQRCHEISPPLPRRRAQSSSPPLSQRREPSSLLPYRTPLSVQPNTRSLGPQSEAGREYEAGRESKADREHVEGLSVVKDMLRGFENTLKSRGTAFKPIGVPAGFKASSIIPSTFELQSAASKGSAMRHLADNMDIVARSKTDKTFTSFLLEVGRSYLLRRCFNALFLPTIPIVASNNFTVAAIRGLHYGLVPGERN